MDSHIDQAGRTDRPSPYAQDAHLLAGNGAQIIGKVNPDLSIKVLSSLDLGTGVGESSGLRVPSETGEWREGSEKGNRAHHRLSPRDRDGVRRKMWGSDRPDLPPADYNLANTVVEISHQHREIFAYD